MVRLPSDGGQSMQDRGVVVRRPGPAPCAASTAVPDSLACRWAEPGTRWISSPHSLSTIASAGRRLGQHVGGGQLDLGRIDAEHPGARRLRVEVDHQHPVAAMRCGRGESEGDGGLADATLLVQQRHGASHGAALCHFAAPIAPGSPRRIAPDPASWANVGPPLSPTVHHLHHLVTSITSITAERPGSGIGWGAMSTL